MFRPVKTYLQVEAFRILFYTERFREGYTDFQKLTRLFPHSNYKIPNEQSTRKHFLM